MRGIRYGAVLAGLFAPVPSDLDRFAVPAPAGWTSWSELHDRVAEADVIANLEFCGTHFDRRFLRSIQIDDGYQKAAGDWDTNEKFPQGLAARSGSAHRARLGLRLSEDRLPAVCDRG